ncbi:hypothetical protein GCM10009642_51410 [Nocardiopsis metallicus]
MLGEYGVAELSHRAVRYGVGAARTVVGHEEVLEVHCAKLLEMKTIIKYSERRSSPTNTYRRL